MPTSQSQKKEAIAQATEQELASLAGRGVRISGNACSPIVLVKGDLDEAECSGGELAAGADGAALRKALGAIGYAPEDFCVLASVAGAGDGAVAAGEALPCELFREALETLDPEAVLLLDNSAADVMRETYADMLVAIDDFDTAMLKPGLVAHVQGRRVLALDGFEAALTDKAAKQRMWAYIKQLPRRLHRCSEADGSPYITARSSNRSPLMRNWQLPFMRSTASIMLLVPKPCPVC